MSNTITIEFCAEDRARIDRLIAAVEKRTVQVESALEQRYSIKTETEQDPMQRALAEALSKAERAQEAAETPTDAQEEQPAATEPTAEETPTGEAVAAPTTTRTVTRAELRTKVVELSAKGLKEQARQIVTEYAPTVPGIPEDKITECYDRLVALGG